MQDQGVDRAVPPEASLSPGCRRCLLPVSSRGHSCVPIPSSYEDASSMASGPTL